MKWQDIKGYEGLYKINEDGSILSLKSKYKTNDRIIKCYVNKYGYPVVYLTKKNKTKTTAMTTLQQSKIILENKIALNKGIIARKKKEFDQLKSDADELQLIIEKLVVETWQDEAALKAVNEEISRIPTLAYQKIITTIVAVFICLSAFSQAFIGGEATNHGVGMNSGYMLNKVQLQIGVHAPITSDKDKPFAGYGSVGYQISINDFSIIPAIGIAKYNTTDFSTDGGIEINKTVLFPSLEIGKESVAISGIKFRYYLFVDHAVKTFVGAGLKFFIQ